MRSKSFVLGVFAALILMSTISTAEAGRTRYRYVRRSYPRQPLTNFNEWFRSVTTINRS